MYTGRHFGERPKYDGPHGKAFPWLSAAEVGDVVQRLSRRGLAGGIVYDALIAEAATKAGVDCLITLNPVEFRRVVEGDRTEVREP